MPWYPDPRVNKTVGGFHIWNWWQYRDQMVANANVRGYLDRYFSLFVQANSDRELRIAVISRVDRPCIPEAHDFSEKVFSHFVFAVMACHLFDLPYQPVGGWMACSSDNFAAFHKEFDPMNKTQLPSFLYGSYVKTTVVGSWEHLRFTTPQYMPGPSPSPCEDDLLARLSTLCVGESEQTERLFRSLGWINLAFANYDGLRPDVRIVAMVTAFEILLDFPGEEKGRYFAETMNQLLPPNTLPTTTKPWGRRGTPVTDNDVGWWCREFYDLRSKIVHGEVIRREDGYYQSTGVEHLRIGLSIFEEGIRGLLVRMGRMTEDDRRKRFWARPTWREQLGLPNNVWYS